MYSFKAIRPPRVSEEVAEQIKQAILQGHFKAGEKLPPERQLADEFEVSRVCVREALRVLEISGFVMTRQGASGGAFVTDLTLETMSKAFSDLFLVGKFSIPELCDARLLLEPEITRMATECITPAYAKKLEKALKREEEPIISLSKDLDTKTHVHFLLLEMCENRLFRALDQLLLGITRHVVEAVGPDPETMHPAGMHRPVVEAVIAGDSERAASEMRKHVIEFGENLRRMEADYLRKLSSGALMTGR